MKVLTVFATNQYIPCITSQSYTSFFLQITLTVVNGLVEDVVMKIPQTLSMSEEFEEDLKMITSIRGHRFTEEALDELNASLGAQIHRDDGKHFVTDCVRKVMASV